MNAKNDIFVKYLPQEVRIYNRENKPAKHSSK